MKFLCPLFFLCFFGVSLFAQLPVLTLDDALNQATLHNFDIQIVRNDLTIAQKSDYYGNAGENPAYIFNAGENAQLIGINQKLSNGNEISKIGVFSHAFTTQLGVAYPIFNTYRTNATKGKVREQVKVADARLLAQLQNTAAQVIVRYYDIVRQKKFIQSFQKTIAVSEKRLELVKTRSSVGLANNSDLYLAELDLTARKQELANQTLLLAQAKTELNTLLANEKSQDFNVIDTILYSPNLEYDALLKAAQTNPEIMAAESQVNMTAWMEKEIHAQWLPTVRLNGGAATSLSNTTAGLFLQNISYGPFLGVSLSTPLFNKNLYDRQEEIVRLQRSTKTLQRDALKNTIEGTVYKTWLAYQSAMERLNVEKQNLQTAQKYLDLTMQKYGLGQSNAIDLREAQRSYEDAAFRLTAIHYTIKVAETELLRLAGKLVTN